MSAYDRMTDEQLIEKLRGGDKKIMDYIMEKYKNLVRKEANAMYLLGGENEDLIQEGMIGLFKAVQDYDPRQELLSTALPGFASPGSSTLPSRLPGGRNTGL